MSTITSANATLTITVTNLFPAPVNFEQWAVDDAFTSDEVEFAEAQMGVDGFAAYGYVPNLKKLNMNLMANSASIAYMDTLISMTQAQREVYRVDASISIPSIGKRYVFTNGVLKSGRVMPESKKVLSAQNYHFEFEQILISLI